MGKYDKVELYYWGKMMCRKVISYDAVRCIGPHGNTIHEGLVCHGCPYYVEIEKELTRWNTGI